MIYFALYIENEDIMAEIKSGIEKRMPEGNFQITYFKYEMDLLDYLNNTEHKEHAVIYQSKQLENGLGAAKKIREINPKYRFCLICREHGRVEDLFYYGVSYFILIPFSEDSIQRYTDYLKLYYSDNEKKTVLLKCKSGMDIINLSDVEYVVSDKRKVSFHSGKIKKEYYYKLDEVEVMLGETFLRCHQSFLVNMEHIQSFVQDGLIIKSGEYIPVSRKKYFSSKRQYLEYITGNKEIIM